MKKILLFAIVLTGIATFNANCQISKEQAQQQELEQEQQQKQQLEQQQELEQQRRQKKYQPAVSYIA